MPGKRTDYSAGQEGPIIEPAAREELYCYVNGKRRVLPYGRAEITLLQWLRGRPTSENPPWHSCVHEVRSHSFSFTEGAASELCSVAHV